MRKKSQITPERMNEVDVIVIRGCPGSGKSETGKSLSKLFPKGVRLEVDTIRQMVISVDWKNQLEHINMLEVSTGLITQFLKFELKPIIVIDTFSGDKIKKFCEDLRNLDTGLSIRIFALYTSDSELKKRLDQRKEFEFRDYPICRRLNEEVQKARYDDAVQIDTTGLLPERTAELIYSYLVSS